MFVGRPIMPGQTEVEQLHRIFNLCGSPLEDYRKKLKLSTTFRPPHYRPHLFEVFGDFPESSLGLLSSLLALDPANRGSASSALQNEFFYTGPLACDLSGLPVIDNKDDEVIETIEQRKWAMFGFAAGMLTEYATGSDFVDQLKILLSNFGIIDLE